MTIYCTHGEGLGDKIFLHDERVINGYQLFFDEKLTFQMEVNKYTTIKICSAFICQFLNGELEKGDEKGVFNDLKDMDVDFYKELIHNVLLVNGNDIKKPALERCEDFFVNKEARFLSYKSIMRKIYVRYENKTIPAITYEFDSNVDFLIFVTRLVIERNCKIRICPNCKKYFIPKREDSKYCDNFSPQDEKVTCTRYVNNMKIVKQRKEDPATKLYHQIYNALRNKVERAKESGKKEERKKFNIFITKANEMRDSVEAGSVLMTDYVKWLEDVKSRKVVL
jgi:hypothetical protein